MIGGLISINQLTFIPKCNVMVGVLVVNEYVNLACKFFFVLIQS